MENCNAVYDTAFVACKEPKVETGEFPEHHVATLDVSLDLLAAGLVDSITLSGRYATWYDNHDITPWFGTEARASRSYLLKKLEETCARGEITDERRAELASRIYEDEDSQDSLLNFVHSGENVFKPKSMKNVLVLGAEERLLRLQRLGNHILDGVVELDFASTCSANDPAFARRELFTVVMQERYLRNVPRGEASWRVLKLWDYRRGQYDFWVPFDAALQAEATDGNGQNLVRIVERMDGARVRPDIMQLAGATALRLEQGDPMDDVVQGATFRTASGLLLPRSAAAGGEYALAAQPLH